MPDGSAEEVRKMLVCKCKNCGGQLEFSGTGGLLCPYCGSKSFFSDADLKGNEAFRRMLLSHQKAEALLKENDYSADRLWTFRGRDVYTTDTGQDLRIDHMMKYEKGDMTCYLTRENVVYIMPKDRDAASFRRGLGMLVFPEADTKLCRSFPEMKTSFPLKNGGRALVFRRRPNLYPASVFAPLQSVHLAWVISRMENICCALAYAGIEHGGIDPDTVWIDPVKHEGVLFGDWRGVVRGNGRKDLLSLRRTAMKLAENEHDPAKMYQFLHSAPEKDAFADFEKWDRVIVEGFGGHRFSKMETGR